MRNYCWLVLVLLSAITLPACSTAQPPAPNMKAVAWYAPVEADFRPEYDRDAADRAKQTWSDYYSWVKKFYSGSFFTSGWTDQGKDLIKDVGASSVKSELMAKLNALGIKICKEWAKDNSVRKISSSDVGTWRSRLFEAKTNDMGLGDKLKAAVKAVNDETDKKLAGGNR